MNDNKIIELKTEHSTQMKILFGVIERIVSKIQIRFIKDPDIVYNPEGKPSGGMCIIAFDDNLTCIIHVKLYSCKFLEYYAKYSIFNIGLEIRDLNKFVKNIGEDTILSISIDEDDKHYIKFNSENQIKGIKKSHKQHIIDIDDNAKRLPGRTEFESTVFMDISNFIKICSEMKRFSYYVEIKCTRKKIIFKSVMDSLNYMEVEWTEDEIIFKSVENKFEITTISKNNNLTILFLNENEISMVRNVYYIEDLLSLDKCENLCDDVQIYLKNDHPLFIDFIVRNLGRMIICISPSYPSNDIIINNSMEIIL